MANSRRSYAIIALAFFVYPDNASGDLTGNFMQKFLRVV